MTYNTHDQLFNSASLDTFKKYIAEKCDGKCGTINGRKCVCHIYCYTEEYDPKLFGFESWDGY